MDAGVWDGLRSEGVGMWVGWRGVGVGGGVERGGGGVWGGERGLKDELHVYSESYST